MKGFVAGRFLETVGIFVVTLNQTLGCWNLSPNLGNLTPARCKRTWARWWLNKRVLIALPPPEVDDYQFDLRRLFKQVAENRQLLKVDSPGRSEKIALSRGCSVSDVVISRLLLKPASFFQNYKKSWPSLSTITKRIPGN